MSIIGWIIIGALAGWIASLIMRRNDSMNWLENIVVGIVGALVGGFVWEFVSDGEFDAGFNIGTLLVAIIGASLLLFVYGLIRREA